MFWEQSQREPVEADPKGRIDCFHEVLGKSLKKACEAHFPPLSTREQWLSPREWRDIDSWASGIYKGPSRKAEEYGCI